MSDSNEIHNQPQKHPGRHPRHRHRDRSHASAHAADEGRSHAIPDHPLISKLEPHLVDKPAELANLISQLRAAGRFAYDSEFIGELSYFPKLCLIQVATEKQVSLIDPLAGLDINPFWELVADPTLEKIVHAGQQDLEPVFLALDKSPANIFDIQIAGGFVGLAYPAGLSKLVREVIGVKLAKGFTFTHWDQRPLSSVQMRYAADDVRYLPALRESLGKQLDQRGHFSWAKAECESLCDPALYRLDPEHDYLRIRGASALDAKNAGVLRELYNWRDQSARDADLPSRTYVKDEVLIDLAKRPIKSISELANVRGLPRPVENAQGQAILDATRRGLSADIDHIPADRASDESPAERFASDALWSTLCAWTAGRGIDPSLLTSRAEVTRIYRESRGGGLSGMDTRLLQGWRNEMIGTSLREFLAGTRQVALHWNGGLKSKDIV